MSTTKRLKGKKEMKAIDLLIQFAREVRSEQISHGTHGDAKLISLADTVLSEVNATHLEARVRNALLCVEYLLDDKELTDYIAWADDNNVDVYADNDPRHVYGAARIAKGLGPIERSK